MRVKSEARRQAILEVAAEVFREHGFEQASMAEISARLGGVLGAVPVEPLSTAEQTSLMFMREEERLAPAKYAAIVGG